MTTLGSSFSSLARDWRRERGDVDRALGKRRKTGAHDRRFDGRQVALNVDHDIVNAIGVDQAQRLENAVRSGRVIETGHDRFAAGRGDRLHDARIVRRDPDRSDIRFPRPAPDMDDHGRAVNVGEGLSGKAGRAHARGDEDDGVGHQFRLSQIRGATAYTCCQGERKAANQLSKTNVPPGPPNLTPADESPSSHGPRECEPVRAFGARGGVVRHAAHRLQQSPPVAANAQGSGLRAADVGAPAATAEAPKAAPETPLPVLMAKADVTKGENDVKICATCHNFKEGAGAKIGPDLWNVVGRPVASFPGFVYSDDLKKIGGDWTYDKLNAWIADPKAMAPGTKMAFAGEKDEKKRADILDYLHTLSDKPVALPK